MTTLEGAAPDHVAAVAREIDERLASLENILFAIYNLRELTPRSRDYVISFGERLLAPILAAALRHQGLIKAAPEVRFAHLITGTHTAWLEQLQATEPTPQPPQ